LFTHGTRLRSLIKSSDTCHCKCEHADCSIFTKASWRLILALR